MFYNLHYKMKNKNSKIFRDDKSIYKWQFLVVNFYVKYFFLTTGYGQNDFGFKFFFYYFEFCKNVIN